MDAHAYADARLLAHEGAEAHPTDRGAVRILAVSCGVGAVVAALTWHVSVGLGWAVADAVLVLAVVGGIARWRPGAAGWLLAAASVWLAGMVSWRASNWALVTALPASVGALTALTLVCSRRLRALDLAGVGPAALDALRVLPRAVVDAGRVPARACDGPARGTLTSVARGALVGLPLAGLFAAFLSADTAFRSAFASAAARASDGISLGTWMFACAGAVLVAASVLLRLRAASAAPEVPADGAAGAAPYRRPGDADALSESPLSRAPRVQPVTWGVVLAQIAAVFGVYAIANGRSLFASHEAVQAAGGPTYAHYVHEGFVEVSVAALLAVACVLVGHALTRPRGGAGAAGGGWKMATLELALLGFVALALASSAHRLRLYEEAYGFTVLRLGVRFFQFGIAGLLALTAAACAARARREWRNALAWSAVVWSVVVGSFDADGWVARRSVELAARGGQLDLWYLSTLSEDAASSWPALASLHVDPSLLPRLPQLENMWKRDPRAHGADWRAWRGIGAPPGPAAFLARTRACFPVPAEWSQTSERARHTRW